MNALGYPTCDRQVAFPKPKHLDPLDDPGIACGAGRSDGVVRSGNPKIQCDFPCWVVRHRSGVVVVGPNRRVVIELGDRVDFIFRLDISVFGNTDVNPHTRFVDVRPIQTAPCDRFAGRPYPYGTGSRPSPRIATVLVLGPLKLANSCMRVADVPNVVVPHPAASGQERLAVTLEIWAVGARKSHGGHDNPLIVR